MKRLILALALLMVAGSSMAQFQANSIGYGGSFFDNEGKGTFGMFVGAESDFGLVADTTKGYQLVLRSGYFHVRGDSQIQGINGFVVAKKSLGIWNRTGLYGALGGGGTIQLKDGSDISESGLKGEIGLTFFNKLTLVAGADYYPVRLGKDPFFVYLGVDLAEKVISVVKKTP